MSGSSTRRRARTGSTSRRYKPTPHVIVKNARSPRRIDGTGILACTAVAIVGGLLIALIWIMTGRAIQEQRAEVRERVEQSLLGHAATLAEEVRLELLLLDQSLTVLQTAWALDREKFQLVDWQKQMPALTAVANDLFIADERHIIRQGILPASIGQGVGAAYVNFPHGSLEVFNSDGLKPGDSRTVIAQAGSTIDARLFLMYVVRPLAEPKGWLIGASFRSAELVRLYAKATLGINGVTALLDSKRGSVQALAGPAARRPKVDVQASQMLEAMKKGDTGIWRGLTAIDEVDRIHAYHRVGDRDLIVLVGAVTAQALAPAETLASGARTLASFGSGVVLVICGVMLWELFTLRARRRQQLAFERGHKQVESALTDLSSTRMRAKLHAAQLQAVMNGSSDGIVLLDPDLRLVSWSHRFAAASGLDIGWFREGLPVDELFRQQAIAGAFGDVADIEAEVRRRIIVLQLGATGEKLTQIGPEGRILGVHVRPVEEGGVALVLGDLADWRPSEPGRTVTASDDTGLTGAAPVQW
jgi:PAS domain-containing protein